MNIIELFQGLTVEIYDNFEELLPFWDKWDAFVELTDGDIYLTYDWCLTWWKFYGAGRELRIFIYKNNNNIVGLIPIFFEKQWLGLTWLKIAKIVGSDFTMVIINPPIAEGFVKVVYSQILYSIFIKEQCDAFFIGPTAEKYSGLQELLEIIQEHSSAFLFNDNIQSSYTTFFLTKNFEEYIQSLDSRQRGNLRRDLNLINKSFLMNNDVIKDDKIAQYEFKNFIKIHNEQWEAQGKLGHFNDWPNGAEFNAELVCKQAQKGRLRLLRLLVDGQVVSYELCYAFGKRWHWRLPARVTGPNWNKYALGRIGLIKEIELAIADNVLEIEGGAGHYDYKIKLGGMEYPLHKLFIVRKQLFSRLRALLFLKLSNVLHFFYYRVWFIRLAPKLPFKRNSLWPLWIRTRI